MTTAGSAFGEAARPAEAGRLPDADDVGSVPLPSARLLRSRLRTNSQAARRLVRPTDAYVWLLAIGVLGAIAAGSLRPLARLVTGPGWAQPHAPGRLFAVAIGLLLLGGLAQVLRAAGPVAAGSAFRFWLLATPVRRRQLLRRRFLALVTASALAACVIGGLVAHAASVAVLPAIALAAVAAVTVTAGSVWGQASEAGERAMHVLGRSISTLAVLGLGSLVTGLGRADANAALRAPPAVLAALLVALTIAALVCCWNAYLMLDRIGVGVLSRGQGLWTAGQAATASMDAFLLADFLAEQRARSTGRVRSVRLGSSFALALTRSEWARLRRRPSIAVYAAVAALLWWGCRLVLPGPGRAALVLILGYFLVLPLAGTLKQLASGPGLRAQFANQDRWLGRASVAVCLLGVAAWAVITIPGLAAAHRTLLAALITAGITAAVCRTVTRPPLDYSKPPVPTPFGDLPLDLWRQLFRGPLLLTVLILVVVRIR